MKPITNVNQVAVRKEYPLKEGLRPNFLLKPYEHCILVRKEYPLKEGLRPKVSLSPGLYESGQKGISIKRRIKTIKIDGIKWT